MNESRTVTVGLDVHASSIRLAAVRGDELLDERTLPYDQAAVERALQRWPRARCCYEAGPTGFGLYRHLVGRGIECVVVAPGLVPQRPGDRVKTDPRDARKLAELGRAGLLTAVQPPTPEDEAVRDLARARDDAREDLQRCRHRLGKSLLRRGLHYAGRNWTGGHRQWIERLTWTHAAERVVVDDYLVAIDHTAARLRELDARLRRLRRTSRIGRPSGGCAVSEVSTR